MKRFIRWLLGDPALDGDESIINHPYAKAMTPDQLIASHVLLSLRRNFEAWSLSGDEYSFDVKFAKLVDVADYRDHDRSCWLTRNKLTKDEFRVKLTWKAKSFRRLVRTEYNVYALEWTGCEVDGVELNPEFAEDILREFYKIQTALKTAEEAAEKAKAEMEANEAKWNLAEKLTGLRRNKYGALVPVKKCVECLTVLPDAAQESDCPVLCHLCASDFDDNETVVQFPPQENAA